MAERRENHKIPEKVRAIPKKIEAETPRQHEIPTYEVGLPTDESLESNSVAGPVQVRNLRPGEMIGEKRDFVEGREKAMLARVNNENLIEQKGNITQTIKSSGGEAADIQAISALFDANINRILKIEKMDFTSSEIPAEGEHFLITREDAPLISNKLRDDLGYNITDIPEKGFVAKKGSADTFVFVFAQEKDQNQAEEKIAA